MIWYAVMSLLLDNRIRFLVGFVFVALILAIILIVIENILRKNHMAKKRKFQQTPVDRIKIYLASGKSIQDKLAFIDKTAKSYFNDMYNFPSTSSYSFLIKELEKKSLDMEVKFCKEMFSIFYSQKEISEFQISEVGKMLIEMEQHRTIEKKDSGLINSNKMKIPVGDIKKDIKQKEKIVKSGFSLKFFDNKENISRDEKRLEISKQNMLDKNINKMKAIDENETKKIEDLRNNDNKLKVEIENIERLKRESEEGEKRKTEERMASRAMVKEEEKKKRELEKKRKEDEKLKRREMLLRAKVERQERINRKDRELEEYKKLVMEKKRQKEIEMQRLKEEKIKKLNKERIGFIETNDAGNSTSNEGIAARIIRLQKERLNL